MIEFMNYDVRTSRLMKLDPIQGLSNPIVELIEKFLIETTIRISIQRSGSPYITIHELEGRGLSRLLIGSIISLWS